MTILDGCFIWVRFGRIGRQLAHLDRVLGGGAAWVHKWRDAGRRWTASRILISAFDAIAAPVELADPVVRRAIKAAAPGRPPCHHAHHFTPQTNRTARPSFKRIATGAIGAP